MPKSDFPPVYLEGLEKNLREQVELSLDVPERILMYSGARLNSIGEYLNDEQVQWKLDPVLPIDLLTLKGTSPEWNAYTIDKAEASPVKFRELLKDLTISQLFQTAQYIDIPILVRQDGEQLKVLDGMNRTIAAIRENRSTIRAYVGVCAENPSPVIEPHVMYDFIKAFEQGRGNEEDLKAALRFLLQSYANTRHLFETRFNADWVPNEKIQLIIQDLLNE